MIPITMAKYVIKNHYYFPKSRTTLQQIYSLDRNAFSRSKIALLTKSVPFEVPMYVAVAQVVANQFQNFKTVYIIMFSRGKSRFK